MRRREFIALLGTISWPLTKAKARNDSNHLRRLGVLSAGPNDSGFTRLFTSFEQGLRAGTLATILQSHIVLPKVSLTDCLVSLPSLPTSRSI